MAQRPPQRVIAMGEAERKLWQALRDRPIGDFRFRRQVLIGRYIVDFVCPAARLVVEFDAAATGDAARHAWLVAQGFRVLRLRRQDVERDVEAVHRRIANEVKTVAAAHAADHGTNATDEPGRKPPVPVETPVSPPSRAPSESPPVREPPAKTPPRRDPPSEPPPEEFPPAPPQTRKDPRPSRESGGSGAAAEQVQAPDASPWAQARLRRAQLTGDRAAPVASRNDTATSDAGDMRAASRVPDEESSRPQTPTHNLGPTPGPRVSQSAVRIETRLYGLNACLAAFAARPHDLRKVYLVETRIPRLRDVLAWCVKHRLGYRVVAEADLARITGSSHHEGVCFETLQRPQPTLDALLQRVRTDGPVRMLLLDGVGNPHNFGAVLRAAAHFGVSAVLLPPDSSLTLSGAAIRIAEGGAEAVDVVVLDAMDDALDALRAAGFALAATLPRDAESIYAIAELPARLVFVLGAEGSGMGPDLIAACTLRLTIPGTGRVESLNIANAVGVLLSEHWRRSLR